jgi:glycosyltransferase involved in cell wall biosynthesis
MKIALIVPFLDEERYMRRFLDSLERQRRPPDRVLLVDDGSADGSPRIASDFADRRPYASLLTRPQRDDTSDRLAAAGEYQAFQWAAQRLDGDYDVVAKLDADLVLTPETLATVERELEADPRLGIAGAYLSVEAGGTQVRERCPPYHVRGATKFYRRDCLHEIAPVPAILGWDTIDESAARLHGWRTASFAIDGGDPVHLRPTGAVDGRLRAFRRWGACAYAAGFHPAWLFLSAARQLSERPWGLSGASFLAGWALAALQRRPRAAPEIRAHLRREQGARVRAALLTRPSRLRRGAGEGPEKVPEAAPRSGPD